MRSDLALPKNWKINCLRGAFKEHFNADCFETNSWVEIPEERFKHTREKFSYSVTQEIPAYFTASSKLK